MERCEEMKKNIMDYCHRRKEEKIEYLNSHYDDLLDPLLNLIETLIQDVAEQQVAKEQGKIKYLVFCRLRSSEYTGSYEMLVAMSNDTLYFDDNMSCRYWMPQILYQNLEEDMKHVRKILNDKYPRIEEYEMLRVKQILLLDDWNLFCENLGKLAEELAGKMINSPLRLEDEIQILYGDYMDRLDVADTLQIKGIPADNRESVIFQD